MKYKLKYIKTYNALSACINCALNYTHNCVHIKADKIHTCLIDGDTPKNHIPYWVEYIPNLNNNISIL